MTDSPKPRRRNPIKLHVGACDVTQVWAKSDVPRPRVRRRTHSASERLILIAPMLQYRRIVREFGHRPGWVPLPDGSILSSQRVLRSMNKLATYLAVRAGVSTKTIWRWVGLYLHGGNDALRDKPRADKGRSRWFAAAAHQAAADEVRRGVAERRSIAAIHRAVGLIGQAPSYPTVRDFVRREVLP